MGDLPSIQKKLPDFPGGFFALIAVRFAGARGAKIGHESGVLREKRSSCIVGLTSCIIHENGLYCFADPEKK